jgi:PAS domain S-box-containing protein
MDMQKKILVGVVAVLGVLNIATFFWALTKGGQKKKSGQLAGDLASEKNKAEVVINAIGDGVALIGPDQLIQVFNPAAAVISGWAQDEALGLDARSVFRMLNAKGEAHTDETSPLALSWKSNDTIKDNTSALQSKSDKSVEVQLIISPLLDATGVRQGTIVVFRDVTSERKEEKQRAEFISTASHEMRTPVAAIEGYLALAMNEKVSKIDTKARDYLEKAHSSTQHLGKLFQDLLTAAKSEDGRLSNHPVVVEIGAYLQQIAEDLKFSAEKKGLLTEFVVGSASATVDGTGGGRVVRPLYYAYVDPERMREVITNIFDNAVKYTDQGKVTLGLTGDEGLIQIRVSDTGPGIPAEDIPHLFQKFYRVDNSATRTIGGTGLGLFICRKIIELYSGKIWVTSTLGKGSTFFMNVPRISAAKAQSLQAQGGGGNVISPH